MRLRLPHSLHYPITVTELLKKPEDDVERSAPLFAYTYKTKVTEGNSEGDEFQIERTFASRFESSLEGKLKQWMIKEGSVIERSGEIAEVEEPCSHSVQFGGMCATCGKDMTELSYVTTQSDANRANINMIHDNVALTVSEDEALRVEVEAKRRLLAAKKLSLVVDLDQTIIHATVDPTVAEWMEDPDNPNHEAVKDVKKFQLTDEGPGGKGTWYYIKLRPGLKEFLENISKLYELHIYTMGTRAYARNIAELVDPDRKVFGDRILSRDESGSMVAKNLQRLFPVDTKMVVIIDDRGDVWNWNPNLVKVTPFSFFVGIGDINSSFLPKRARTRMPSKEPDGNVGKGQDTEMTDAGTSTEAGPPNGTTNGEVPKPVEGEVSALEQLVNMRGGDDPETLKEQNEDQDKILAAQLEERPLLQKQKKLDEEDEADDIPDHQRHHLLNNDDNELFYLERSLRSVHTEFFQIHDRQLADNAGGRLAQLRGAQFRAPRPNANSDLDLIPDIKTVMPSVKSRVLKGVNIVFSGVIPLDVDPQTAEIVIWARSFGARIQSKVRGRTTTHVVAARNRTAKVRQAVARGKGKIKIVNLNWLMVCIVQWEKVDETPYLLKTGDADIGRPFPGEDDEEDNLSESESIDSDDKDTDGGTESDIDTVKGRGFGPLRITTTTTTTTNTTTHFEDDEFTDTEELKDLAPPADMNDPESPVGGSKKDWENMNAELEDFLGDSDADDSDADGVSSDLSLRNRAPAPDPAPPPHSGTKRGFEDVGAASDGESDGGGGGGGGGVSNASRKRIAIAKGSALKNAENGLPTPAVTAAGEGEGEGDREVDGDGGSGWSDLEDENFEIGEESDDDGGQ